MQNLGALLPPPQGPGCLLKEARGWPLKVRCGHPLKEVHGSRHKEGMGMYNIFLVHATSAIACPLGDPGECGTCSTPKEVQGGKCGCQREAFHRKKTKPNALEGRR